MYQLKKLSLYVILDAYVTKYAIEDIIKSDKSKIRNILLLRCKADIADNRINSYLQYLNSELNDIESFLDDESNIYWQILNSNRKFFDTNLPKHKKKIKWFHSVDRYPFDYTIFFSNNKL